MIDEIYYEGIRIMQKCNKCLKNRPDYMFEGRPSSNPNIMIFICESCFKEMPKHLFRLVTQQEAKA